MDSDVRTAGGDVNLDDLGEPTDYTLNPDGTLPPPSYRNRQVTNLLKPGEWHDERPGEAASIFRRRRN
ncbi:MAG: hypothetical protein KKD18_05970 [Nanoarchaeota archaeon]|nr:hypothetical protein [Nanoarchaeota archaeon]